ncbi:MAG: deoxyribodipyrimidine photo-lyase [Gammaproteobacteria bacterium]|nr:MAG: deoxyribodipyrimidine photo-lyase [Gammaproteobacteria bacterium]
MYSKAMFRPTPHKRTENVTRIRFMTTLLWFQRDLRINGNPALAWAIQQEKPVIAVYLHSPEEDAPWAPGAASRWWLHHSLEKLRDDLSSRHNITLHFLCANSVQSIPRIALACSAESVVWTNRHEPFRLDKEIIIAQELKKQNIQVKRFNDGLLSHPETFLTESKKTPYKVFTPFYKRLRREFVWPDPDMAINESDWKCAECSNTHFESVELQQLGLLDDHTWHMKLHGYWIPGEQNAHDRLEEFINSALADYPRQRDYPAINGTSNLSTSLHFGEISPQQIIRELAPLIEFADDSTANAAESFLRQLIWREFARYILLHFPHTAEQPMNPKFSSSFWERDSGKLEKWQRGNTGIPIIDAGMRQLWETGWMHNRVRMLVASLLTKNLGIAWQDGAAWFWETLVDADLANNTMGWQWVAGCGVDAAPYFRIFNPYTQTERFDPELHYVKYWNTTNLQNKSLKPIIDISTSRIHALEKYDRLIKAQSNDRRLT